MQKRERGREEDKEIDEERLRIQERLEEDGKEEINEGKRKANVKKKDAEEREKRR